ncbi:MAG TPA: DUF4331 domain-containing protein [Burkholderiaceae bacterium]|nr:DUF4331 domain-containing protein [Burkholderiaceae bacterium]
MPSSRERPVGPLSGIAAAVAVALACTATVADASSHREGPFITSMPKVDGTDLYAFRSYEPGRAGFVTLVANYLPLQDPYGGPNYFSLDTNALYEIHVDNDGDSKEDLTFRFRFSETSRDIALNVGGKNVPIPLVQAGQITDVNPAVQNRRETYRVDVVRGDRRTGTVQPLTNVAGAAEFDKPLDNIGTKTFGGAGGYEAYANRFIQSVNIPGCQADQPGRLFVGQRKDPFAIPVGKIFDLVNLNPVGPTAGVRDDLADKNVTSLILEVPIACLTKGTDPVIGVWTTASVRQGRLIDPSPQPGLNRASRPGGAWTQVSRLGMPLVNEVVIGLRDKDRFNASKPSADTQFIDYVTNPTLPALIQTLFPSAPAPTKFPRQDLVVAFLTGVPGLNRPANVTPSEMLRLNTSIAPVAPASQQSLGVLAGDNAGFPNGRRPGDDVVDISLRVAMGVLCTLNQPTAFGCVSTDAPAGAAPVTDGVAIDASRFLTAFPYLTAPLPGSGPTN